MEMRAVESHRGEEAHSMICPRELKISGFAQEDVSHKRRFSRQDRPRIAVNNTYSQGDRKAERSTARAKSK